MRRADGRAEGKPSLRVITKDLWHNPILLWGLLVEMYGDDVPDRGQHQKKEQRQV